MVSVEKTTTTASVAPHGPSWADGFMDILAKYERNSERQLYVYGISASRCPICRHRVKTDGTACEKCGQTVSKKSEKCTRCAKSKPELWCYECDKYFCEVCHKKPHTLMLGGEPQLQHNCYPIDGSSGKLFRHGSWSSNLLAMTKDARKQQVKRANDLKSKGPRSVKSEPASVAPSGPSVQSAPAPSIQPAAPFFGAAAAALSEASSHSVQHEPVQQSTAPAPAVDYGIYNSLFERVELPPAPVVDLTATSPSGSTAIEDPLKVAVIEEYDRCNEYTLKIEAKITSLNAAVRKASLQDVNMAAKINEHIIGYRQTLERAIEMRYRALAKVVLFSPDVRTQARSFEQQQLGDVPHVLTACHNKSAQIAIALHQMQKHLVDLRHRIDRAIASGDPTQLMQLQTLGNQITETEQQIRQAKKDRDSQFVLMVQFSRRLRETVQREANASVKPPH
ncbi:hypothetical protein Poli38472_006017 [Pythium oligandrum]|uniref:B box-type domain-containing protein n=1 Tax=Pythium oligandrum TaxID=41045 RepID=A0A8K1FPN6_PYTOL|nr:hypothetical protein Poli38472_006017 [Pythium oligandrum]|eukprot:TMW68549.1 hypothetical protein Poli38472_006017 [Pythium oligandrum]